MNKLEKQMKGVDAQYSASYKALMLEIFNKSKASRILSCYNNETDINKAESVDIKKVDAVEKLSLNIKNLLTQQILNELKASQQYKQCALWLDENSFTGGQKLFLKWSNEELEHMNLIYSYLLSQNCTFVVPNFSLEIENEFEDVNGLLNYVLTLEMNNTEEWRRLASQSKDENDFQTYTFAEQFLNEQIEEENKVRDLIFKLNLGIPPWELDEIFEELSK